MEKMMENINNFINKNDYKRAFGLFILFLERLGENEKKEVIDYYSKHMIGIGLYQFPK